MISETEASARRILLVDDHPVTRQGIAALIAREPNLRVAAEASTVEEAAAALEKGEFDLAILDVSLGVRSGMDFLREVRALRPQMRVLMLSMHDEMLYAERALRSGAHGYLMKRDASEEVAKAIRTVLSGEIYLGERTQARITQHNGPGKARRAMGIDSLSNREMEVFRLIAEGHSTAQIAQFLELSVKTIECYREHLKTKLGLQDGRALLRYAVHWSKAGEGVPPPEALNGAPAEAAAAGQPGR